MVLVILMNYRDIFKNVLLVMQNIVQIWRVPPKHKLYIKDVEVHSKLILLREDWSNHPERHLLLSQNLIVQNLTKQVDLVGEKALCRQSQNQWQNPTILKVRDSAPEFQKLSQNWVCPDCQVNRVGADILIFINWELTKSKVSTVVLVNKERVLHLNQNQRIGKASQKISTLNS